MVGFKRGGATARLTSRSKAASRGQAGGTTSSYPDGGSPGKEVGQFIRKRKHGGHADEAQDRKLIRKMIKQEEKREKA